MSITRFDAIADFDTISGATEDPATFNELAPGFLVEAGEHVLHDNSRIHNEVFKFHMRCADADDTSFKFMVGVNSSGVGQALQFDYDATNLYVRLVTASGIDVAYDTAEATMDLTNMLMVANDQFIPIQIEIQDNKIRCRVKNIIVAEYKSFQPTGTYFGFANLTGSANVYVSDLYWYNDQIVYGNVNLNGAANADGIVVLYNQSTYDVVEYRHTDNDGEYFIFIDDDPANLNKYFMYGFVEGQTSIQPRGVSNITL